MADHSGMAAQPGMAPDARRTAGTMFAALYGELMPHTWRDPKSKHDAYQLFYQRSVAMGWLDDVSAGGDRAPRAFRAPGLWGMNDAGWDHPLGTAGTGLVSWFQVEAGEPADDRPLPVRPFLHCAREATARTGTLTLAAVQVLLPVGGIDPAARPPYAPVPAMLTTDWFAERAPDARTPVEVTVSGGQDPSVPAVVGQLGARLDRLDQQVFECRSAAVADPDAGLPPPVHDAFWNGPARHATVLRGELVEWSCDAIGWLAEAVADLAAQLGVRSPLLCTVARSAPRR